MSTHAGATVGAVASTSQDPSAPGFCVLATGKELQHGQGEYCLPFLCTNRVAVSPRDDLIPLHVLPRIPHGAENAAGKSGVCRVYDGLNVFDVSAHYRRLCAVL